MQEFDVVISKDFPEVNKRISNDIADAGIQKLVGKPLLTVLGKVTVAPIKAVKDLSNSKS